MSQVTSAPTRFAIVLVSNRIVVQAPVRSSTSPSRSLSLPVAPRRSKSGVVEALEATSAIPPQMEAVNQLSHPGTMAEKEPILPYYIEHY